MPAEEIRSISQLHQTVHAGKCWGERQLVQVQPQVPYDLSKLLASRFYLWPWSPQSRHSDPNTSMYTPQDDYYYRASERLYSVEKQYLTSSEVLGQECQVIDPLCRETVVRPRLRAAFKRGKV